MYLAENLKPTATSFYLGIFYAFSVLGPAVGFILGGVLLTFFTDFDQIDTSECVLQIIPNNCVQFKEWL